MRKLLIILNFAILLLALPKAISNEINQKESLINSSRIIIESDSQSNDSSNGLFVAKGNVKITYPEKSIVATSSKAEFNKIDRQIILIGNVDILKEGAHSLSADKVVFYIDSEKIIANSKSKNQVLTRLSINSFTGNNSLSLQ